MDVFDPYVTHLLARLKEGVNQEITDPVAAKAPLPPPVSVRSQPVVNPPPETPSLEGPKTHDALSIDGFFLGDPQDARAIIRG